MAPALAERESPRPYVHPLWTLAGEQGTHVRSHDHVRHKGLALTSANLSGDLLSLRYQVVISDGAWSREQVETYAGEQPLSEA